MRTLSAALSAFRPEWALTPRHARPGERGADVVARVMAAARLDCPRTAEMMLDARFLPAGRTLRTASPEGVVPNCTALPPDARQVARALDQTIGVGAAFDDCADPVAEMRALGALPPRDATGRRPGLMATLLWSHPRAAQVCAAKASLGGDPRDALNNLNISLRVPEGEWPEFRRSAAWRALVAGAHACGDPGLLVQRADERARQTSPCGEIWLAEREVCNLGNLNLARYATARRELDADRLERDARLAFGFLRAVSARMVAPFEISKARVGLGVMGFADLLSALRLEYGGRESLALIAEAGAALGRAARAHRAEHGLDPSEKLVTLAPTGGTALIVGASHSIEPYFCDALALGPGAHLAVLAAWQAAVDNGVSKTVNLPRDASLADVERVFDAAFALGCKGVTVFRDGCRDRIQPLALGE